MGLGAAAVFVPDEEMARTLEGWSSLLAAEALAGLWPDWSPETTPVAIVPLGSDGVFLLRGPSDVGRPVAGRDGRTWPCLARVEARELDRIGIEAPGPSSEGVLRWQGQAPLPLAGGPPSGVAAADLVADWFARWWGAGRPANAEGPTAIGEETAECAALTTVEGRLLATILREPCEPRPVWRRALQLLLVRRERRVPLEQADIDRQRARELRGGLPLYVALRWAQRRAPAAAAERAAALERALADLGAGTAAGRDGSVGMALALVLDRMEATLDAAGSLRRAGVALGWRERVCRASQAAPQALDAAMEATLPLDGGSRDDAALRIALDVHGYAAALDAARKRIETAAVARSAFVERILHGSGTLMSVDVSALGAPAVHSAAGEPQPVHARLYVYPEGADFRFPGGCRVTFCLPVACDLGSGLLQARVAARPVFAADGGADWPTGAAATFSEGLDLRLPGLQLLAAAGTIHPIDGGYLLRLLR